MGERSPEATRRGEGRGIGGVLVLLLCFLAFAARALTLTSQGLWLDEVDALAFAARPVADLLAMMTQPAQNGPLYYLFLKGWTALAGTGEWGLRSFSLMAGIPAIPLTYHLGRRLLGREAGLWAALFMAASPYLFFYGQEGKMYALYLSLSLASMAVLLDSLARGGARRWLTWLALTAAGVYVHLFFVYVVAAQHAIVLTLLLIGVRPKGVRGWYATQAAALLPLLPLAVWGLPAFLSGYRTAFEARPLPVMAEVLFLRFSLHTEAWPPSPALLPFGVALGAAVVFAARQMRRGGPQGRAVLLLLVWLIVPLIAAYLTAWQVPVFMHRYFMPLVPAYYLLLAVGVAAARARLPVAGWLAGAGITAMFVLATPQPAEVRPDFRGAAAYVAGQMQSGDRALFVAGYAERPFRYYLAAEKLAGGGAPYTNNGLSDEMAALLLGDATVGARRVWLVEFEEWLWDSRGVAFQWLTERGRVESVVALPGVRVTRVDLAPVP